MVGLLCLLVLSVFMVPGYGHARLDYLIVVLLIAVAVIGGRFSRIRHILPELAFLYGLMLVTALSIFVYYSAHPGFHWRDLMSVVRLPVYGLIITGALYVPMDQRLKKVLATLIVLLSGFGVIVSAVQYSNLGGVNEVFLRVYQPYVADYLEQFVYGTQERRVIGTAGNPNLWGFILVCYAVLIFARTMIKRAYWLLPILLGLIISIVLTGSRSSLIAFMIGALAVLLSSARFVRARGPIVAVASLFVLAMPVFVFVLGQVLGSERFTPKRIGSMYLRFYVWEETIREYQNDLLLGRGPAKSLRRRGLHVGGAHLAMRDNNYVAALAETGIIGLALLLGLFATAWARLWRLASRVPPSDLHWVLSALGIMTAWIAFNATADAFNNVYLSSNVWVFYGLTLAIAYGRIEESRAEAAAGEVDSPGPGWDPLPGDTVQPPGTARS